MTNESLDMSVLNERIHEQQKEIGFYKLMLECLIEKYNVQTLYDREEFLQKFKAMSPKLLHCVFDGEVPEDEVLMRENIKNLDTFVQENLFIIGTTLGTHILFDKVGKEQATEYMKFLMECKKKGGKFAAMPLGFAALTLQFEMPPTLEMVKRMFGPTEDDEHNQESFDIIAMLNGALIPRYLKELAMVEIAGEKAVEHNLLQGDPD